MGKRRLRGNQAILSSHCFENIKPRWEMKLHGFDEIMPSWHTGRSTKGEKIMQIDFRATPEGKRNVLHHFTHPAFPHRTKVTVIPTHDGVHVAVHTDGPHKAIYDETYVAAALTGVMAYKIVHQNLG